MLPEPPESSPFPLSIPAPPVSRTRAIVEVVICSGYATQLLVIAALSLIGIRPDRDGTLSPLFIFTLTAADTVLLLSLILLFLRQSGDSPRDVFLGGRPLWPEVRVGVLLLPLILIAVMALQVTIRYVAPWFRNVEVSPFMPLFASPLLLVGFIALVLIGGGIREELQRAFLLKRFDQRLGGARLGILITSLAFGLGHTVQGWDAAVVTAIMGAFWGVLYLTRGSVVSTVTNHALFNVTQILLGYAAFLSRA